MIYKTNINIIKTQEKLKKINIYELTNNKFYPNYNIYFKDKNNEIYRFITIEKIYNYMNKSCECVDINSIDCF